MTMLWAAARVLAALMLVATSLWAQDVKEGPQTARVRAEKALGAGDIAGALRLYEELAARQDASSPSLLRAIALASANTLRRNPDPRVRIEACSAVLTAGPSRSREECLDELNRLAVDTNVDVPSRVAAARVLVEAQAPGSAKLLESVVGHALGSAPASTADALSDLPPALSNETLKRLAISQDRDARYIATLALARRRTADMLPILRATAADTSAGASRLVAYIGLAASGDAGSVKIVRETLPLIQGRERVEAALALSALKDPEGVKILAQVTQGDHELLRFDAADALHASRRDLAERVILTGLRSANPWVRARAIRSVTALGIRQTADVRRALVDTNPWVAVVATRAILSDTAAPRRP